MDATPTTRLDRFFGAGWNLGGLVRFHTRHKLELFSHHEPGYRELGRLVATGAEIPVEELERRYRDLFAATLAVPPTRARHVDTLAHALGHLRGRADAATRRTLRELVDAYRRGAEELSVVRRAVHGCATEHAIVYLVEQTYFTEPADGGPPCG